MLLINKSVIINKINSINDTNSKSYLEIKLLFPANLLIKSKLAEKMHAFDTKFKVLRAASLQYNCLIY
jgi:hypothetical protein